MTSFDAIFRRLILSQTFVRGWGNPQHLQELCVSRRAKVSKRNECLKLVPADSIHENTVEIIKQETKGDRQYITAKFPSPMAAHFPNLVRRRRIAFSAGRDSFVALFCAQVPPEVGTGHFQLVLPLDHRLGHDTIPIGICYAGTGDQGYSRRRLLTANPLLKEFRIATIIVENPYYGFRRPRHQDGASLSYVTDLFIMGGGLMLETMAILHWCQKMKLAPAILHGFSLGGYMASLAFTT